VLPTTAGLIVSAVSDAHAYLAMIVGAWLLVVPIMWIGIFQKEPLRE
jgi:hypothetical protein